MPKVSVVMPTCNRPEMVKNALRSVLDQTYQDFEVIVVDDGLEQRAEESILSFNDKRIKYIKHKKRRGGGAARNTGVDNSKGEFIAFLDDDDKWVPKKLEIQMKEFEKTSSNVGFSFTAVVGVGDKEKSVSKVLSGVNDYFELAMTKFNGFMTSTLVVKKNIFDDIGVFNESYPSHQEVDLILRITKKYKGLGINKPLTRLSTKTSYEHIGSSMKRKIKGRKMILENFCNDYKKYPKKLAKNYFQLAIFYRDDKQYKNARKYFFKAIKNNFKKALYWKHYLSLLFGEKIYLLIKKFNNRK